MSKISMMSEGEIEEAVHFLRLFIQTNTDAQEQVNEAKMSKTKLRALEHYSHSKDYLVFWCIEFAERIISERNRLRHFFNQVNSDINGSGKYAYENILEEIIEFENNPHYGETETAGK